ncbi:MAG: hypothetical protein HN745_10115 [Deltaproteobacteria bacterium]|jgi:hypothetical protein|nr:hypothetical protein [Deltaproteobacteria bacterium]MBT7712068.1 hypothetical protein [Deltaproteobacteria bacterium]
MPIKKLKAIYIDPDDGKQTKESLVIEVLVSNKGQPDFKTKETFGFFKMVNPDTNAVETYPFLSLQTGDNTLLCDFGDAFTEYSKEQMETPTKPKCIKYCFLDLKSFPLKVGGKIIMMYSGEKHPYEISRVEDYK